MGKESRVITGERIVDHQKRKLRKKGGRVRGNAGPGVRGRGFRGSLAEKEKKSRDSEGEFLKVVVYMQISGTTVRAFEDGKRRSGGSSKAILLSILTSHMFPTVGDPFQI